ncbi:MAG: LCP family protein [Thermoleophilia bacterium]|nr:LCP family protein [Thermoleophilia bacterium]
MSEDRESSDGLHRTARYYRAPRRRRAWLSILGWSVWGVIGVAFSLAFASFLFLDETLSQASPDTEENRRAIAATRPATPGEPVNVLLIGSDVRPDSTGNGLSDSLILVRLDKKRGFVSMLSFPRDLYTDVPGYGFTKINNAYGFGGAEKAIETIQGLTGQDVNHYVNVDFDGFRNLVDAVDGVYIDVDRRYFNDNSGPGPSYEAIDLEPGYQRLRGEEALDYVRYRHTDSDFARARRQQKFLAELKRQTKQFGNLRKFREFAGIFGENVVTSVDSVREMISLIELALVTPDDRIARIGITGGVADRNGLSVVLVSDAEIQSKVADWLNPDFEEGDPEEPVTPATVRLRVDNGSGRVLVSQQATDQFVAAGFRQAVAGGTVAQVPASTVLHSEDGRSAAKVVEQRMGESATLVLGTDDELRGYDVVAVVGPEYAGSLQEPPPPQERPERAVPVSPMVDTESLIPVFQRLRAATKMNLMVPLKVPRGSRARRVRAYRINTGGDKEPNAIKLVFDAGGFTYFGITQTEMKDPPILDGRTGVVRTGGREYWTYYDGRNLQRLAWRKGNMTYWITNTLDYKLTDRQMYSVAKSARPLNRATLPKGAVPEGIEVELEGSTP